MDLSRVGKEAGFRDPEVSSDWVMVGAIPVDELLKCEMEQAGLLEKAMASHSSTLA